MAAKRKVFIADDDTAVLEMLRGKLELAGYEAITTSDPKQVMPMIKVCKPNLILLDLLMPNLGGLEICEMLNRDKETEKIPIIIISGLAGEKDIKSAYRLGVISYFTKPCDLDKLVQEIKKDIYYKEDVRQQ
jgi:DNA-binding response OmpR family regulator